MIVFSVIPASSQCAFRLWGPIIAFHQELEAMERFIPPWRNLNKILLEFVQRLWVELEEAFAAGATAMHDFGPLEDEQNAPVQSLRVGTVALLVFLTGTTEAFLVSSGCGAGALRCGCSRRATGLFGGIQFTLLLAFKLTLECINGRGRSARRNRRRRGCLLRRLPGGFRRTRK